MRRAIRESRPCINTASLQRVACKFRGADHEGSSPTFSPAIRLSRIYRCVSADLCSIVTPVNARPSRWSRFRKTQLLTMSPRPPCERSVRAGSRSLFPRPHQVAVCARLRPRHDYGGGNRRHTENRTGRDDRPDRARERRRSWSSFAMSDGREGRAARLAFSSSIPILCEGAARLGPRLVHGS